MASSSGSEATHDVDPWDSEWSSALSHWATLDSAPALLDAWIEREPRNAWGIDALASFEPAGVGPGLPHVALGFITHGNEWGTLPAALTLLEALQSGRWAPRARVSLLLGNVAAARKDARFLEEDFNRVFVFDQGGDSLERQRAREVRPFLDNVDFLLDVHQTQTPSESAFWTFPWSDELAAWARFIAAAPLGLTRRPGGAFAPGRLCLDEYVRDRGKLGITLEVGTRGPDREQAERTLRAALRFVAGVEALHDPGRPATLQELAREAPPVRWFETVQVAQAQPGMRLRKGLGCWTPVKQGELLSAPDGPQLRAEAAGRVLFPKYAEPLPPEILRVAVEVEDPDARFAR